MPAVGSEVPAVGPQVSAIGPQVPAVGAEVRAVYLRCQRLDLRCQVIVPQVPAIGPQVLAVGAEVRAVAAEVPAFQPEVTAVEPEMPAFGPEVLACGPWARAFTLRFGRSDLCPELPRRRSEHLQQVELALQRVPPSSLRLHGRYVPVTTLCRLLLLQPGEVFVHPPRLSRKPLDFPLQTLDLARRKHPEPIGVRLSPERGVLVGAAEAGPRRREVEGVGHFLADGAGHHSGGRSQVGARDENEFPSSGSAASRRGTAPRESPAAAAASRPRAERRCMTVSFPGAFSRL